MAEFVISGNGNVGIGTTTPNARLSINGGKTNTAGITVKSGDVDLIFTEDAATNAGKIQVMSGGTPTTIGTNPYTLALQPDGGNVGIGTSTPSEKLEVIGTIKACTLKVEILAGCDFVFENNYSLMNLENRRKQVPQQKRLPYMKSAQEMEANGIDVSETMLGILHNTEDHELYLYNHDERIEKLEKENRELRKMIEEMMMKIDK